MEIKDLRDCELDNPETCYHLTRTILHDGNNGIKNNGLVANIGIRSKDGVGNEKTPKVFFAKSLEGALIFINRNLNIFFHIAKHGDFENYRNALSDDSPEEYEAIYSRYVHEGMTEEEITSVVLQLGKLYFQKGIYYKLDLKHCTKEEFENMSSDDQEKIDYFDNDINEERPNETPTINNMHTRTGRSIAPSQITIMSSNGSTSALDVIIGLGIQYQNLHPGQDLPVLVFKNGKKDRPLLQMLIEQYKEQIKTKSTQDLGKETLELQNNTTYIDETRRKFR